jgi:hypothetical protein
MELIPPAGGAGVIGDSRYAIVKCPISPRENQQ